MLSDILNAIENVDPVDTNKLDEIDARCFCIFNGWCEFEKIDFPFDGRYVKYKKRGDNGDPVLYIEKYTRSLDAIKNIQPDGWDVLCFQQDKSLGSKYELMKTTDEVMTLGKWLPTEELARLHAVLQAIEWDRNNG